MIDRRRFLAGLGAGLAAWPARAAAEPPPEAARLRCRTSPGSA